MNKLYTYLICFLFIQAVSGQTTPFNRLSDWSGCGYPGNIPDPITIVDVITFGAVGDGTTDNFTPIQNAINSLGGAQGVILFPSGNFLVESSINLPDSVILRGASSDSTKLIFNLNGVVANAINISGSTPSPFTTVLAGYQRGSNYITVTDASTFSAGDYAELQEDNGSWDSHPISWADNSVGQIFQITAKIADTLYFDKALRIDYDPSLNIQVRRIVPTQEAGIECLGISRADNVAAGVCFNIYFNYAVNCWVRGVESSMSIGSHIEADASSNIEISGSYFHDAYLYDGVSTHGYGITLFKHTGQCKIENNILKHLRHSISMQCGANGNIIAYNYSLDPNRSEFPANFGADISMHGHFTFSNLFEGNIVQNLQLDSTWGPSGPLNTFLRNRIELYGLLMSGGVVPTDSQNFCGNEITGSLPFGQYIIAGNGHFEFGNNIRGTITPTGTTPLNDTSFYLTTTPAFWTSSSNWPSIGIPNTIGSGTIPAKDRYDSQHDFTVCNDQLNTMIDENYSQNNLLSVYPNPFSDFLNVSLKSENTGHGTLSIESISGRKLFQNNITIPTGNNLSLVNHFKQLQPGIYFLKIETNNKIYIKKIMKTD